MDTTSSEPNRESRPGRNSHASRMMEGVLWVRAGVNVVDLTRRVPPMVASLTTNPTVKETVELAKWLLHAITDWIR